MSGLLKPAQVAERLSFSRRHVVALAERGELPGFKLGTDWRFSPEAVDAYLAAHATGSVSAPSNEGRKAEAAPARQVATSTAGLALPDDYVPVFPELWGQGATPAASPAAGRGRATAKRKTASVRT